MYTPWISDVLHIEPISPQQWLELLGFALSVLVVMELHNSVRHWLVSRQNSANYNALIVGTTATLYPCQELLTVRDCLCPSNDLLLIT